MTTPTMEYLIGKLMTACVDVGLSLGNPIATRRAKIRADKARTALLKALGLRPSLPAPRTQK